MASKMSLSSVSLVRFTWAIGGFLATAWLCLSGLVQAADDARYIDKIPGAFDKKSPETLDDLRSIQEHAEILVKKVMPSVVSVRIGPVFGSGVIVSKDGYVLTAGHVSGEPNRNVTVYFHDGKRAKGKTLGSNRGVDSGLIKITTEGAWPYLEMGDSTQLREGQWCMVVSYPGGFKPGRTPPVRLGRILKARPTLVTTDCILVGGDSGGPLFDMHGKVIGINIKIGESLNQNMHAPVNLFRATGTNSLRAKSSAALRAGSESTLSPISRAASSIMSSISLPPTRPALRRMTRS